MLFRRPAQQEESTAFATAAGAEPDDAELVAAARVDRRAFAPLYERYLTPVYRYCYVRLGSREAAEDATSEVFLKAMTGLPGFRDGPFAAWLFRIAHNVIADRYRRRRGSAPIEAADTLARGPTPEDELMALAERQALREAIGGLPDDQRAAVELQLAGWSGQQIADALSKSVPAVKQLRFRAMNRLRAALLPNWTEAWGGPA